MYRREIPNHRSLRSQSTIEASEATSSVLKTIDVNDLNQIRSKQVQPIYMLQRLQLPTIDSRQQKKDKSASPRRDRASFIQEYLANYRSKIRDRQKDQTEVALKIRQFREHRFMPNGSSKNRQLEKILMRREARLREPRSNRVLVGQSQTIEVSIPAAPWRDYSPRKTNSSMVRGAAQPDFSYL